MSGVTPPHLEQDNKAGMVQCRENIVFFLTFLKCPLKDFCPLKFKTTKDFYVPSCILPVSKLKNNYLSHFRSVLESELINIENTKYSGLSRLSIFNVYKNKSVLDIIYLSRNVFGKVTSKLMRCQMWLFIFCLNFLLYEITHHYISKFWRWTL